VKPKSLEELKEELAELSRLRDEFTDKYPTSTIPSNVVVRMRRLASIIADREETHFEKMVALIKQVAYGHCPLAPSCVAIENEAVEILAKMEGK